MVIEKCKIVAWKY